MATSAKIGDGQPVARNAVVSSLPISDVTLADLNDATSAVNSALESGKRLGSTFLVNDGGAVSDIVIAQGTEPTDEWHRVSDAGAAPIVPA